MNAPLHNLIDAYIAALSRADEDGVIDAETTAVLDELTPKLEDKLEALAGVRARYLAEAEANDQLAKQYHAKSVARGKEADRIEAYMLEQMQRAGLQKVRCATATVYVQATPHVEVDNAAMLGPMFVRVVPAKREPDKAALLKALKAGEVIAGARLVLEEGLRVR